MKVGSKSKSALCLGQGARRPCRSLLAATYTYTLPLLHIALTLSMLTI